MQKEATMIYLSNHNEDFLMRGNEKDFIKENNFPFAFKKMKKLFLEYNDF